MTNNSDQTSTTVYRPDLVITKTAVSDTNGDGIFDLVDNAVMTDAGQKIRYTLGYDNIGNTVASGVVLSEMIPAQTCYIVGSLEQTKPLRTHIEYSNNSSQTYTYIPVGATGTQDCAVTHWRLKWDDAMSAPSHIAVDSPASTISMQNIVRSMISGKTSYRLKGDNDYDSYTALPGASYSRFIKVADLDGDGDMDLI